MGYTCTFKYVYNVDIRIYIYSPLNINSSNIGHSVCGIMHNIMHCM